MTLRDVQDFHDGMVRVAESLRAITGFPWAQHVGASLEISASQFIELVRECPSLASYIDVAARSLDGTEKTGDA